MISKQALHMSPPSDIPHSVIQKTLASSGNFSHPPLPPADTPQSLNFYILPPSDFCLFTGISKKPQDMVLAVATDCSRTWIIIKGNHFPEAQSHTEILLLIIFRQNGDDKQAGGIGCDFIPQVNLLQHLLAIDDGAQGSLIAGEI
jgi:hypothetical protein